ncbi:MAG: rod-binding protein [Planctomycetes bacterium]|nr:rod-binding protein [Planctomycetota bacterium]
MIRPAQDVSAALAAQALARPDPSSQAKQLLQRTQSGSNTAEDAEKKRVAAKRLESLFATMLVKEMRSTQSETGMFGSGTSADVYGGWFDQFLGEVLSKHGELHLADSINRSLGGQEGPSS